VGRDKGSVPRALILMAAQQVRGGEARWQMCASFVNAGEPLPRLAGALQPGERVRRPCSEHGPSATRYTV
jgi:hypothetical protein